MKEFDVAIIGGGAAGLYSAINLKDKNIKICIIEALDRVGKKILSTGNGKCNILNANISVDKYNDQFLLWGLEKYSHEYLVKFLMNIGILIKEDQEGREYPHSESANTVLNLLRNKLSQNIEILSSTKATSITKNGEKYFIETTSGKIICKYLIFATGSDATSGLNSHSILAPLGHRTTKLIQSLVPIKIAPIKGVNGVRSKVKASLYLNNNLVFEEFGEILFKENALSGILSFKMSTHIARAIVNNDLKDVKIFLDFAPLLTEEFLKEFKMHNTLEGLVHKALYTIIKDDIKALKHFEIKYLGLMGKEQAQVTSGGIDKNEIDKRTCESKINKNLFIIGEVLDIDGECGGYNLGAALVTALMATDCIKERC